MVCRIGSRRCLISTMGWRRLQPSDEKVRMVIWIAQYAKVVNLTTIAISTWIMALNTVSVYLGRGHIGGCLILSQDGRAKRKNLGRSRFILNAFTTKYIKKRTWYVKINGPEQKIHLLQSSNVIDDAMKSHQQTSSLAYSSNLVVFYTYQNKPEVPTWCVKTEK